MATPPRGVCHIYWYDVLLLMRTRIIGFSARDEDLLGLLSGMPAGNRVTIVGRGDGPEIFRRICSFDRSFETKELSTRFWDEGFSTYVESPELDRLGACWQG